LDYFLRCSLNTFERVSWGELTKKAFFDIPFGTSLTSQFAQLAVLMIGHLEVDRELYSLQNPSKRLSII
jgi:hypothetical protein